MTSKTFTPGTIIDSDWLNDVNNATYNGSGVYTPVGTGSVPTTVQNKLRESISVLDFGADATGVADSTVAFQNAINYGIANNKQVNIPTGIYQIDSVQIKDAVYSFTLHSDNALLTGTAAVSRKGLIDIVNCVDFHMTGSWQFNGANNSNYATGLCIRAQTGTSQATSRVNVYNPTFRNFQIGIGIGQYDIDYQCSEINVFGANFFKCPIAVYNGGSQTGVVYNGCNLVSEINTAFVGSVCRAIWMEGGFVTVVGGSVVNAESTTGQTVLFNPASSTTYGNPYGLLRISGAHIETASQLVIVANNRSLTTPVSDTSNVTVTAAGGYVSGGIAAQDFIFVGDTTYTGYIQVTDCNFYSGDVRTAYNISSASSTVKIKTDKSSFNKNFKNWLDGVFGGKLLHNQEVIVDSYGINTTLSSGESIVKYINAGGSSLRYGPNYSTSTGLFTVPSGGFKSITINAVAVGGSVVTGDIYIKQNGSIVAFGRYTGLGTIVATLQNLAAGDTIGVYINQASSNTFNNGSYQRLIISAETQ